MQPVSYARTTLDERLAGQPSWIILVELFIGLGWIRAATEKIIDGGWWRGRGIELFVDAHSDRMIWWFRPIVDQIIVPNPVPLAVLLVVAQLAAGAALISGRHLISALHLGMTMNLGFILAGAVTPSIFYLLLQAVLALWLLENHAREEFSRRSLRYIMIAAAAVGVASLPSVQTVSPSLVTEDPAMVLVTYSISISVSCFVARNRLEQRTEARRLSPIGRGFAQHSDE